MGIREKIMTIHYSWSTFFHNTLSLYRWRLMNICGIIFRGNLIRLITSWNYFVKRWFMSCRRRKNWNQHHLKHPSQSVNGNIKPKSNWTSYARTCPLHLHHSLSAWTRHWVISRHISSRWKQQLSSQWPISWVIMRELCQVCWIPRAITIRYSAYQKWKIFRKMKSKKTIQLLIMCVCLFVCL